MRFAELADRTAAEAARGHRAERRRRRRPSAPEDPEEFYDHQLVGLRVETTDGDVVGELGRVDARRRPGPARDPHADGREVLVPFVTALVPEVDVPRRPDRQVADRPGLLTRCEE